MQCPECRAEHGPDAALCTACGALLEGQAGPPSPEDASAQKDAGSPPGARRTRRVLLVTVCIVALIAAGAAAVLLLREGGDASPLEAPSEAETDPGSVEASASGDATSTAPKTETPTGDDAGGGTTTEEPPAPLGFPTPEAAARAALEANGNGEYILAPAREDEQLAVYWAGPPQSEWVYEIIVQRLADGSWSVTSMTNIWEDYEVP